MTNGTETAVWEKNMPPDRLPRQVANTGLSIFESLFTVSTVGQSQQQ